MRQFPGAGARHTGDDDQGREVSRHGVGEREDLDDGCRGSLGSVMAVIAADPARVLPEDLVLLHRRVEDGPEQGVRLDGLRLGRVTVHQRRCVRAHGR